MSMQNVGMKVLKMVLWLMFPELTKSYKRVKGRKIRAVEVLMSRNGLLTL